MYLNCQGYLNNKDQLLLLIRNNKPLIVCLTETHITEHIMEEEYKVDGYNVEICNTKNSRTGGVSILL